LNHDAIITRLQRCLVLMVAGCLCGVAAAASPVMSEPLGSIVLPDKPANAHWVWIGDYQYGQYGRSILFNADSGDILGMIDMGWEGIKLDLPRTGNEIYNFAMYMSRGFRGERTDVVTTYDKHTLQPLRELIVPAKGIKGWPDPNLSTLSDDDRFLFMQFLTPAASIGVVDVKANRYLGEIETSGCAHVMAAGVKRFFTLCGDGSALVVTIGEDGNEVARHRTKPFFDPEKDPIHGSGTRSGDKWYFASHRGQIYVVDVSGPELAFAPAWSITEVEKGLHWVSGPPMQPLAIHHATRRLYVLMHASDLTPKGGGYDFHREEATEVWVYDLDTKRRLRRMPLKHVTSGLAVSQDAAPLLYGTSIFGGMATVYDEASGKPLRDIPVPMSSTIIQPLP